MYPCTPVAYAFLQMVVRDDMGAGNWTRMFLTCAISPAPFYFILKIWIFYLYVYELHISTWYMWSSDNLLEKRSYKYHLDVENQTQVLGKNNKCSSGAMLSFHFQYLNFYSSIKVLWILDSLWCPGCWAFSQATPTLTQFWHNFEFMPRTMVFLEN